jgi:hypothetical protein
MASVSNITNKVFKNLGKSEIDLITTAYNQKAACVGLSFANLTQSTVRASVFVTDDTSVKGYYLKEVAVPPNASLRVINGGEKLLLAPENTVSVLCDTNNGLDVVFSLVVITYT